MKSDFLKTAKCVECGRDFDQYRSSNKYCSKRCYRIWYNREHRMTIAEKPCLWCEKIFQPKRPQQVYCDLLCKRKANAEQARLNVIKETKKECFRCQKEFEKPKQMSFRNFSRRKECPECTEQRRNKEQEKIIARGGFQFFDMPHYEVDRRGGGMRHKRLVAGEVMQI